MSEALDRIYIRDLETRCIVGIYPEERIHKQDVILNITLWCDLSRAGATDNIDDTVNYKGVNKDILAHVEASEYFLIERMAETVAQICLESKGVRQVEVTVDKPGALRYARSVAVTITRRQPDAHD